MLPAGKLPFSAAPSDDRGLPDMHLALYNDVVVFDHATKLAYVISWVHLDEHPDVEAAYQVIHSEVSLRARRLVVCASKLPYFIWTSAPMWRLPARCVAVAAQQWRHMRVAPALERRQSAGTAKLGLLLDVIEAPQANFKCVDHVPSGASNNGTSLNQLEEPLQRVEHGCPLKVLPFIYSGMVAAEWQQERLVTHMADSRCSAKLPCAKQTCSCIAQSQLLSAPEARRRQLERLVTRITDCRGAAVLPSTPLSICHLCI